MRSHRMRHHQHPMQLTIFNAINPLVDIAAIANSHMLSQLLCFHRLSSEAVAKYPDCISAIGSCFIYENESILCIHE